MKRKRRKRRKRKGRLEETSAVHRRSLVQDFYPAELRRNLWMPFPYPQDTNSTLPTRLLSFYRSYIPRDENGCPRSSRARLTRDYSSHQFSAGLSSSERALRKRKLIQRRKRDGEICNSDFSDCFLLCLHVHVPSLSLCLFLLSCFSLFLPRYLVLCLERCSFFFPRIYGESFIGPRELFIRNFRRPSREPRVKVARLAGYVIGQHLRFRIALKLRCICISIYIYRYRKNCATIPRSSPNDFPLFHFLNWKKFPPVDLLIYFFFFF